MSAFAVNLFNVMDPYGALGDGKTDDTEKIQAAMNDAAAAPSGGRVVFPPGLYVVSRTLRFGPRVVVEGGLRRFGMDLLGSGAFPGDPRTLKDGRSVWKGPISALMWKGGSGPLLEIAPGGSHTISSLNFVGSVDGAAAHQTGADGPGCEALIRCVPYHGADGPGLLSFKDIWLNAARIGIQVGLVSGDRGCSNMFFERLGMEDLEKGLQVTPRAGANYLLDSLYARLCRTVLSLPGGSGLAVSAAVFDRCGREEGYWSVEIGEEGSPSDEMDGSSYRLARFTDLHLIGVPRLLKALGHTRVFFDGLHEHGDRRSPAEFIRLEGAAIALNQARMVTWPIASTHAPLEVWDSLRLRDSCLQGPPVADRHPVPWLAPFTGMRLHYTFQDCIQQLPAEADKPAEVVVGRNVGWKRG